MEDEVNPEQGHGDAHGGERMRWPTRDRPSPRPSSYRYLLDLDPDLADALDVRMRLAARPAATAVTLSVDPCEVDLSRLLAAVGAGPGVLAVDGVLACFVRVGDRVTAELIGAGDLIQPSSVFAQDEIVGCEVSWRVLVAARFALLDDAFADRVLPWPQIGRTLLRRASDRARGLNVQRAIAAQPRLEVRLTLLMWHLAARWGKVEPGGIRLVIPLTHQLLGKLVGAERPSVSHALGRLAHAGVVTGHGDEWHLHGTLDQQLASMIEPDRAQVRRLVADISPPRS